MESAIFKGSVTHIRHQPIRHLLKYQVFYLYLDLDEAENFARETPLFSIGKWNLTSLKPTDYQSENLPQLKTQIIKRAHTACAVDQIEKVRLLTIPRLFGYAFNPMSTYFCFNGKEQLVAIVYEVHNTFGEKHRYVTAVEPTYCETKDVLSHSIEKAFRVSPFMPNEGHYDFTVIPPTDSIAVSINFKNSNNCLLSACFIGKRHALTASNLLAETLKFPANSIKVYAGIHWEALKLWLKGVKLVTEPK